MSDEDTIGIESTTPPDRYSQTTPGEAVYVVVGAMSWGPCDE